MELIPVDSSMIASMGYDPQSRTLVILYNNGKAYEYYNVPPEEYQGLLAAESKGKYINANIKDVYEWAHFKGWKKDQDQ
jgi:hypothetical protein